MDSELAVVSWEKSMFLIYLLYRISIYISDDRLKAGDDPLGGDGHLSGPLKIGNIRK